ncbi:Zinc/iron permease [Zopfochytrium polystomum]|nr:Zinc/iron permease [Zopfochytrium polystomum]
MQNTVLESRDAAGRVVWGLWVFGGVVGGCGESSPNSVGNSTIDDVCAASDLGAYDLHYHIASIFIVFAVSFIGTFGTLLLGRGGSGKRRNSAAVALQLFKLFGIGVIAGTAWIHLLPDAFSQFGNPCLQGGWASYGTAYVGLFGLIAAFVTQILETSAMSHGRDHDEHHHDHNHADLPAPLPASTAAAAAAGGAADAASTGGLKRPASTNTSTTTASAHTVGDAAATTADDCGAVHPSSADGEAALTFAVVVDASTTAATSIGATSSGAAIDAIHSHATRRGLSTAILEAGIVFHSLVIGLTLGVTADDQFAGLLAAVCFHQLFEGMALGSLLADLQGKSFAERAALAIMYPLSTPVGIVVGVAVHNSFNENATALILVQGILDSLSAGVLMYNTYTELMSVEVVHNPVFRHYSKPFKVLCYCVMYSGAAAMALVGIWA